jgi:hypothetical protein
VRQDDLELSVEAETVAAERDYHKLMKSSSSSDS